MENSGRILAAEALGTAVLVMGGPGSAILAGGEIGFLGISLAFGLALLVMVYAIGPISGCHINPAVTVGMWAARKTEGRLVWAYFVGQFLGAALGAVAIFAIANGIDGFDATNNFAQNGWGEFSPGGYNFGAMVVVEIVFTAMLVFTVLLSSNPRFTAAGAGLAIGLVLTLIHLVTIPVDNTSVNPARSFASALFAGADAWQQLWAFFVFPVIGAIVGLGAWYLVTDRTDRGEAVA